MTGDKITLRKIRAAKIDDNIDRIICSANTFKFQKIQIDALGDIRLAND